jgi:hypothetical protein
MKGWRAQAAPESVRCDDQILKNVHGAERDPIVISTTSGKPAGTKERFRELNCQQFAEKRNFTNKMTISTYPIAAITPAVAAP